MVNYNPASFLSMLESEGIMLKPEDGKLWPNKRIEDEEIRGFIVANREAIKKELEGAK